jgi:hypothetical protein
MIIWNDLIRLHTFQNGKRLQNVDRPTSCEMQINLKYRVSAQKAGLFDFMQRKS